MSILDEREPGVPSLKLIIIMVSLVAFAGFAGLFLVNGAQATAHQSQGPTDTSALQNPS